jgi:hypothetical protein
MRNIFSFIIALVFDSTVIRIEIIYEKDLDQA